MNRPLPRDNSFRLRAVIFEYKDQYINYIVVAHRSIMDRLSLSKLIDNSLKGLLAENKLNISKEICEFDIEDIANADFSPIYDWGRGDKNKLNYDIIKLEKTLPLSKKEEEKINWLIALGIVYSNFSNYKTPVIGINITNDKLSSSKSSVSDGWSLVSLPLYKGVKFEELRKHIRKQIFNPRWYTEDLNKKLSECKNGGDVSVGIIFTKDEKILDSQILASKYQACLSLPFPLTIIIEEKDNGETILSCFFDKYYFCDDISKSLFNCLICVYEQLNNVDNLILENILLLSEKDQQKILKLSKFTKLNEFTPYRLDELFSMQARKTPDLIALSYESLEITYKNLEQISQLMANNLTQNKINAGDRIGICLPRSLDLIASMIAVLKVKAIYIPMDPAYPEERLLYTCEDSEVSLVISDLESFPASNKYRRVSPKELKYTINNNYITHNKASFLDPAYIIYTSGSTGKPKGVVIPHINVVNLIEATRNDFSLNEKDIWTFFHSAAFDFSVWEIWGCLLTGAHLVIVPYWISRSTNEFLELLREKKVTILNQTPSAFFQLLELEKHEKVMQHLRLVIFGGEPLDTKILLNWFDRYPEDRCRLVNMFGITETTVHVTSKTIKRQDAIIGSRSVGSAIPGWRLYILDNEKNILPVGVVGEIYVGGAGVAVGYLNRSDLNNEHFIEDKFFGGKMYRSGDKGILLSNGCIEHLGRLDNQIKLRGFRIELDEIRKVLLSIYGVQAVVVILNQSDKKDPATAQLDSYIVLSETSIENVISKAKKLLPDYMIPSSFTIMESLPLTANGKIDLKCLPVPKSQNINCINKKSYDSKKNFSNENNYFQSEENLLTKKLVNIWSKVLGCNVVPEDNFFSLGGNSLFAVRIASAMRLEQLTPNHMRDLYIHQTIEKLVCIMLNKEVK